MKLFVQPEIYNQFSMKITKTLKNIAGITFAVLCVGWLLYLPFNSIEGNRLVKMPFLADQDNKYVLVFFGYPGCNTVCPTNLQAMAEVYTKYQELYQDNQLAIIFVNLLLTKPPEATKAYAERFHKSFTAYQLSEQQLNYVGSQLGLYTFQSDNNVLEHSDYIYLLIQEQPNMWHIKQVYKSPQSFAADIWSSLNITN